MVKLYLVRHCHTQGSEKRIFQGGSDTLPSQKGEIQLELLALRFRNIPLDAVYTSPLGRAVKTAEAVNQYHHLPLLIENDLREISLGAMDGASWEEIPRRFPEQARLWNEEPWLFAPEGGEPMRRVYDRASAALCRIAETAEQNGTKTLALFSHGSTLRSLLCFCLGLPLEQINGVEFCPYTGVTLVEWQGPKTSGGAPQLRVVYQNDASHLPEEQRGTGNPFFRLTP